MSLHIKAFYSFVISYRIKHASQSQLRARDVITRLQSCLKMTLHETARCGRTVGMFQDGSRIILKMTALSRPSRRQSDWPKPEMMLFKKHLTLFFTNIC